MGTGLSHGCAHFEERKDGDGRCVIFVFLHPRRRLFTLFGSVCVLGVPVCDVRVWADRALVCEESQ